MYSLRTLCICGKSVLAQNLMAHQLSKGCKRMRALGQRQAEKGGPDPLFQCQCGMILEQSHRDDHTQGQTHHRFLRYIKTGFDICEVCFAPHKCSKQLHQSSTLHEDFYERRKQYIVQKSRTQIGVWQQKEEEVERQQRQINELQLRLQNLQIQESRQDIGAINQNYDRLRQNIQRQRQIRTTRLAQQRQAGLRRRQIQEQRRREAYQRNRNERRGQNIINVRDQRIPQRANLIEEQNAQNGRRYMERLNLDVQQRQNQRHAHRGFTQPQLDQLVPQLVNGHCSICIEDLQNIEGILLPCRHSFHTDCIKGMLRRDSRCPQCRLNLRQRRQQVIY